MQIFILSLLVAVAAAAPLESSDPVEVVVNGLPDGHALDVADIVDIKLQNHVDGEIVAASNLLYPYTAEAIIAAAEAAAAEAIEVSPVVVVESAPEAPTVVEVAPEAPIVVESPAGVPIVADEAPVPVVVVEEADVPEPVSVVEIAPGPVAVVENPEVGPSPVAVVEDSEVAPGPVSVVESPAEPGISSGTVFNDGTVEVQVNLSQEASVFSSVHSWFSMVLNYFSNGVQSASHQIA